MAELLSNENNLDGCWEGLPGALRGGAKCRRRDYVNQANSSQRAEA